MLLFRAKTKPRAMKLPFDFMVDDVDALQRSLKERGFKVGPMAGDADGNIALYDHPFGVRVLAGLSQLSVQVELNEIGQADFVAGL